MKKNKHTVIDLFAGCGGLSLGLYQAGWRGLFAIEKNEFAFETLRYNLIENKHHFKWPDWLPQTAHDINDVLKNYSKQLKDLRGKVDLVAGGPPCQGFSMAGKRVEDVNKMAQLGTRLAHTDGGVPNFEIEIDQIDEYNLGELFYMFEIACGISGYMLGVNPFNQPGVESYKKNMFALLGKPGYESLGEELKARL